MERYQELTISVGTLVKIALVGLGCYLSYFFVDLILIALTAIVIASAVEPLIQYFARFRVPRMFSVLFVFVVIIGSLLVVAVNVVPPIAAEGAQFAQEFPTLMQETNLWIEGQASDSDVFKRLVGGENNLSLEQMFDSVAEALGFAADGLGNIIGILFGSIVNLLLILVLAFYFASQEYGIDNFLKIVVPPKHSRYAINLWRRSQRKIGLWMQGQLLVMIMTGVLMYLGLMVIGIYYPGVMKYAAVLALIAALAELVPVVGAFIAAVPALAVGYIAGGMPAVIMIGVFYLVYQQVQGNLIYPMVVNKVVGVSPIVVIIGLVVGAQLFGILGAILSVPFAAAFMEYIKDVEKQHAQEIMRRKMEEDTLADKIAEKVLAKAEHKAETESAENNEENNKEIHESPKQD